jgi:hypothetical protein
MTMEIKNNIPYFDVCRSCEGYFARHVETIEICKDCIEIHTQDFWGMGVPTE